MATRHCREGEGSNLGVDNILILLIEPDICSDYWILGTAEHQPHLGSSKLYQKTQRLHRLLLFLCFEFLILSSKSFKFLWSEPTSPWIQEVWRVTFFHCTLRKPSLFCVTWCSHSITRAIAGSSPNVLTEGSDLNLWFIVWMHVACGESCRAIVQRQWDVHVSMVTVFIVS